MSEKKDGGPAFPWGSDYSTGMSLRDYFAGQAMLGLLACPDAQVGTAKAYAAKSYAAKSYQMADAMLLERAK